MEECSFRELHDSKKKLLAADVRDTRWKISSAISYFPRDLLFPVCRVQNDVQMMFSRADDGFPCIAISISLTWTFFQAMCIYFFTSLLIILRSIDIR